jgi:hypothetical protein
MCCGGTAFHILVTCVCLLSQLRINEVLYDPEGPDTGLEFVELINAGSQPVPLSGYELQSGNGASQDDWKAEWSGDMVTALDPDSLYVIGESAVVPEPDEITALDLQNGPDAVRLLYFGEVVDVVGWGEHTFPEYYEGAPAHDVSSGMSLVRQPDGYDTDNNVSDLLSCEPTPGGFSSRATDVEIALDTVGFSGNMPAWESSLVPFAVTNVGRRRYSGQAGVDLVAGEQILDTTSMDVSLAPRESVQSAFSWTPAGEEYLILRLVVSAFGDQDSDNNSAAFMVRTGEPNPAIVINEIMASPSDGPEWVEIISLLGDKVEMEGWTLGDGVEQNPVSNPRQVLPGDYIIICQDTSGFLEQGCHRTETDDWETLSRDDTVVLRTRLGLILDSVSYVSAWGVETGKSLERARPDFSSSRDNWGTCQDESGGTPCRENSIYLDAALAPGRITASPNPFQADGNSSILISYEFSFMKALSRVRIFDRTGVLVRSLANGKSFHGESSEVWDGTNDSGELLPTGIYIVLVEATSEEGRTASGKLPVAVVRKDN